VKIPDERIIVAYDPKGKKSIKLKKISILGYGN